MSTATVKAYVSRILTKLECANRVQVAILVHEADRPPAVIMELASPERADHGR